MLPIYIICHANCEPQGYLCTYFDKRNIPYKKINIIKSKISDIDLNLTSAIAFMGGPYSVNGNHSWLDDEIAFIKTIIEKDIPLMGVCFGAQVISKALGAEITMASSIETGWHQIKMDPQNFPVDPALDLSDSFEAFEWHEDTFSIPDDATPMFNGLNLKNQGYIYKKVLVMQFHLEMTEHMVHEWLGRYNDCLPEPSAHVQSSEQITSRLNERLTNLNQTADKIYDWWLKF
jgi:GMP synthase (glutamine-hydrolysing)